MHQRGLEGQLGSTTRVLVVSSRLELLTTASLVLRLGSNGDVEAFGTPSQVLYAEGSTSPRRHENNCESGKVNPDDEQRALESPTTADCGRHDNSTLQAEDKAAGVAGRALTTAEDRAAGTVAKHIYHTYFSYAVAGRGGLVIFSIIAAYSAGQAARVGVDVWLSQWATASETAAKNGQEQVDSFWWVAVAALIVLTNFLVAFGRALLCVSLSIR